MSKQTAVGIAVFVILLVCAAAGAYYVGSRQNDESNDAIVNQVPRAEEDVENEADGEDVVPAVAERIEWTQTGFLNFADTAVSNVPDMLVDRDGHTVYAAYYDENRQSYVATSRDVGKTWSVVALPEGVINPRALRQLSDGSLLLGVSSTAPSAILYRSDDGAKWEPLGVDATLGELLPNDYAATTWDILELGDGTVLLATDSLRNDLTKENPSIHLLRDGNKIEPRGSLPGIGVLSLALGKDGTVFASTEESPEHDDPANAGQAHVFRSSDKGLTWSETGPLEGANRVYQLYVNRQGTIFAGTGISGEFYRSKNGGASWEKMSHVPASMLARGEDGKPTSLDASRVYSILELQDGRMVVGTGNKAGDAFATSDEGQTWETTGTLGPNNVVWSLSQASDGTIWVGTGSSVGDIFIWKP